MLMELTSGGIRKNVVIPIHSPASSILGQLMRICFVWVEHEERPVVLKVDKQSVRRYHFFNKKATEPLFTRI